MTHRFLEAIDQHVVLTTKVRILVDPCLIELFGEYNLFSDYIGELLRMCFHLTLSLVVK